MNHKDITIFIIDDDPAVRDSLSLMLQQDDYRICSFESGDAFIAACNPDSQGCAIVDIRMPGMDGIQLQEEMIRRRMQIPVIFLTAHGDIPKSVKAMKAGAVDFLTKPVTRKDLLAALQTAGKKLEQIRTSTANHLQAKSLLDALTERERQVTALAILGHSNKEIARKLGISHRTIEIHKSNIMKKTGALNLLELAKLAHDGGLSN
ncbi:MAG: DNA-binding response regulator [Betaproteobacteria bacterium HGW-Betaproteobacteria-1]|jgi:FixJ family two-component response regulator|nr:MAG: DNA-binding response regulator [Betaproteobacteria bacterium HGW-Betaproteobacteria-1]